MLLLDTVEEAIAELKIPWATSRTQVNSRDVPDPDVMSYFDGKYIDATYLYTDLMESTKLLKIANAEESASVISAFLKVVVRIIRNGDGHIRSFDGDRVMGVFAGPDRHSRAVGAALRINFAVKGLLAVEVKRQFKSIRQSSWALKEMTGIASGEALLVRAGVNSSSDLISVGVAPNFAAKLSDLRNRSTHRIAIDAETYQSLQPVDQFGHDGKPLWAGPLRLKIAEESHAFYRTNSFKEIQ